MQQKSIYTVTMIPSNLSVSHSAHSRHIRTAVANNAVGVPGIDDAGVIGQVIHIEQVRLRVNNSGCNASVTLLVLKFVG